MSPDKAITPNMPVLSRHLVPLVFSGPAPWPIEGGVLLWQESLQSGKGLSCKAVASLLRCAQKRINARLYSSRLVDHEFDLMRSEVIAIQDRLDIDARIRRRLDLLLDKWEGSCKLRLSMIASIDGFGEASVMRVFNAIDAVQRDQDAESEEPMKIDELERDARYLREVITSNEIRADDVRLCGFLSAIPSMLHAEDLGLDAALNAFVQAGSQPEMVGRLIQQCAVRVRECAGMTLDEELPDIVRAALMLQGKAAQFEIMCKRLGVFGDEPCSIADLAKAIGCSRETLYLYERALSVVLKERRPYAPTLRRCLRLIRSLAEVGPVSVEQIGAAMQAAGLARRSFSFESLLRMADFMGLEVGDIRAMALPKQWKAGVMVRSDDSFVLRLALIAEVRAQCTDSGAAQLEILQSRLSEQAGMLIGRDDIDGIIEEVGCEWLDDRQVWLWEPAFEKNRAVQILDKMLTVCGRTPLPFDEYFNAYVKTMGHTQSLGHRPMLPYRTMQALVNGLTWCRMSAQRQIVRTQRAASDPLSSVEKTAVVVLSRNRGGMRRDQFRTMMATHGISESAIYQVVEWSPVIVKRDCGTVGLCGQRVTQSSPVKLAIAQKECA